MSRYIEVQTALSIIDKYAKTVTESEKVVVNAVRDIVEIITPAADVVPINPRDAMKPVFNAKRGALCPACDGELDIRVLYCRRFRREEIRIKETAPYCKWCGQRLDWREHDTST